MYSTKTTLNLLPVSGLFSVLWNRYIKHVDRNKIKAHEASDKVKFFLGVADTELNVPRNIHSKIKANFTWMKCSILLLKEQNVGTKWTSLTMKTTMLSGGHHSNDWWPLDSFFTCHQWASVEDKPNFYYWINHNII